MYSEKLKILFAFYNILLGGAVIMVRMIIGKNGKGKSKVLLEKVNNDVKETLGNVVFLDTTSKHMYDLNNKIRLINVSDYIIKNSDVFVGFLEGIISQDHDLQLMFFDNFLSLANCTTADLESIVFELEKLSEKFNIDMYLSVSTTNGDIPESLNDRILVSL